MNNAFFLGNPPKAKPNKEDSLEVTTRLAEISKVELLKLGNICRGKENYVGRRTRTVMSMSLKASLLLREDLEENRKYFAL